MFFFSNFFRRIRTYVITATFTVASILSSLVPGIPSPTLPTPPVTTTTSPTSTTTPPTTTSTEPSEPSEPTSEPSEPSEPSSEPSEPTPEPSEPTTPAEPTGVINYVSLGDSYAAMGSFDVGHDGPSYCYRSLDNYGQVILNGEKIVGTDVSCSGAEADSIYGHQWVPRAGAMLPPQVDALSEDTQLVSLTVGANDLGQYDFGQCVIGAVREQKVSDCAPQFEDKIWTEMDNLPSELDKAYAAIREAAPNAHIVTGGYMPILTENDQCRETALVGQADRQLTIDMITELNKVVEPAANRNGATYVMPEGAENHTACAAPSERWVEFLGFPTSTYPMHPTSLGHRKMAEAMLEAAEQFEY
ncbi:SGNH/GDSL hydrolase family protein [Corynebacterium cystitidis]|uniref:SGNH/GDSL hydrolase family protein n=1 Tax=Corynebacterium cystitidis TaxID=35757 RepID=UPI00211F0A81|nr:SGNH/GDSL hydrolase family protein [Corynebacterium cystitidis]